MLTKFVPVIVTGVPPPLDPPVGAIELMVGAGGVAGVQVTAKSMVPFVGLPSANPSRPMDVSAPVTEYCRVAVSLAVKRTVPTCAVAVALLPFRNAPPIAPIAELVLKLLTVIVRLIWSPAAKG